MQDDPQINDHRFVCDWRKIAQVPLEQLESCKHLTGYWINKPIGNFLGNFRCYECQCQFHIGDNLPANYPTRGIEVWI